MKDSYYFLENDNFRAFINCGSGEFCLYWKFKNDISFSGKCRIIKFKYKVII